MPPSKAACQVYLQEQSVKAKLIAKAESVTNLLALKRKIKQDLKFGKIDLRQLKLSELSPGDLAESAIKCAKDVSENFIGTASKSGKDLLKTIYMQLIKIILASPELLFSLVYIPKDEALSYAEKEQKALVSAQHNILKISSIVRRWYNVPINDNIYYSVILSALPYIKDALEIVRRSLSDLNNTDNNSFENALAFDEHKYDRVKIDIDKALEILKTKVDPQTPLDIASTAINDSNSIYKTKSDTINKKYDKDKKSITDKYLLDLSLDLNNNNSNEAVIRQRYTEDLKKLDSEKKIDLDKARSDSSREATDSVGSNYRRKLKDTGTEFVSDSKDLIKNLGELSANLSDAYSQYTAKQLVCYNIYNIDSLIRNLMRECLELLKPNPTPIEDLSSTETYLELAYDKSNEVINKFNRSDRKISSTQMSNSKLLINSFLTLADKTLNVKISKTLRKLLDTTSVLQDTSGEFNVFIKRIANIPDWDGKLNVWAITSSNVPPPYIQAIAKSFDLAVETPFIFNSSNPNAKGSASGLTSSINKSINNLLNHNNYVISVLRSYSPPEYSELGDLVKALKTSGTFSAFVVSFSINTVTSIIQGNASLNSFGNEWPNFNNCKVYPELYNDPNIVLGSTKGMVDQPAYGTSNETAQDIERNSLNNIKLNQEIKATTED